MKKLSIADVYTDCDDDDFMLIHLDLYFRTNDANWFIRGYTGKETKIDRSILAPHEAKIMESYYVAVNDRSSEIKINTLAKIDSLQLKFITVSRLIERMWKGFGSSIEQQEMRARYIMALKDWGFKMNIIATLEEDANRLNDIANAIQGIKTQISLLKEKVANESKGESVKLAKWLIMVGNALGLNFRIDPKTTPVKEWVEMCKRVEDLAVKN